MFFWRVDHGSSLTLADGFNPLSFNLFIVIIGVTGLFIGAMPGLPVNGVAIVLPLTFIVPPSSAIILLAAIYYGAMYGGAVSSILPNTWRFDGCGDNL